MHNILITKNVDYGATVGGDTVTMGNLTSLEHGAIAIVGDYKDIITAGNADGVRVFQFIVGITKDSANGISTQNSVPIFRDQVTYVNFEKYSEPVTQIVEVGPFPAAAGTAKGEIGLTLNNNSYIRTIQTDQLRINEYKKPAISLQIVLQKIVDRINNGTGLPIRGTYRKFLTASLVGTTEANFKIRLQMKTEGVDFSMAAYGLAEDVVVTTVRKAVLSKGKGSDVRQAEDEYSGNLGNSGFGWRQELYYSKPYESDPNGKYDIMTIQFTGLHDTPQNKVRAASNWLTIAFPTGSNAYTTVKQVMDVILPQYKASKDPDNESNQGEDSGAQ